MPVKLNGKPFGAKPQQAAEAPAKVKKSRKRITNKGYPPEVYARLFEYVAAGEDLTTACKHQHMPTPWTVRRRMLGDDQLADQFKTAQAIRLHGLADTLVGLPDEALAGYAKVSPADRLTAAKQKADSIRFLLTKGLADYQGIGEDSGNVTVNLINSPDAAVAAGAGAAPFVPAGQPVLKIVGGAAQSIAQEPGQING